MSNTPRPEQQAIPPEVMNAELVARLDFTERRLLAISTVAYNLELKCSELTAALADRSEEIALLRAAEPTPASKAKRAPQAAGEANSEEGIA